MVMNARTVRAVARAVEKGLRTATRVPWIGSDEAVQIRFPMKVGSRITPEGVARRLLVGIRRSHLTQFTEMELPPRVDTFRASTKRFSVRAYEDYNLYRDRLLVWFDVLGARG